MSSDDYLDPGALEVLRMLDAQQPGSFSEFVRMFVSEAPEQVRRIEQAHAAGDRDSLGKAAHYLRSAALAMGARPLVETCLALERMDAATLASADGHLALSDLRHVVRDALIELLQQVPQI